MKSLKKIVLVLIFVVCCGFLFSQETSASENATRPKVGLVLAGGGAKGIAHLPVIKAIDELGIPIDFADPVYSERKVSERDFSGKEKIPRAKMSFKPAVL